MSLNDWLKLNVGGKTFLTTRSTLTSCPDSTLSKMFDPDSGLPPAYSEDGVYYLDTNQDCFSVILDWLRYRKLMLNPGIDINNVREVADFFGLVELCRMIDTKKKDSLLFVEGTWVTRGPVLPALNYGYACYHHVFSRTEGNRLEFVPLDDRQETLLVDVKDGDVGWVETTTGNIPRGAIRVGEGENMFIGKKKSRKVHPDANDPMWGGYVSEDGHFRPTFFCDVERPNYAVVKTTDIQIPDPWDRRFNVLCVTMQSRKRKIETEGPSVYVSRYRMLGQSDSD